MKGPRTLAPAVIHHDNDSLDASECYLQEFLSRVALLDKYTACTVWNFTGTRSSCVKFKAVPASAHPQGNSHGSRRQPYWLTRTQAGSPYRDG